MAADLTTALAPLALYAADRGDRATVDAVRWYVTNVSPGGARATWWTASATPTSSSPRSCTSWSSTRRRRRRADPRPGLPLAHAAPGLDRYFARTCWCPDASWFTYALTWKTIDHQGSDGNDFELYRKGEWLDQAAQRLRHPVVHRLPQHVDDRERRGHGGAERAVRRHRPQGRPGDRSGRQATRRCWPRASGDGWFYALGDATALYNWTRDERNDVKHASRSVVWLEPDHVVVYDRAETGAVRTVQAVLAPGCPHRPRSPARSRRRARPGGQQVFSTTLLPADAAVSSEPDEPEIGNTAIGERRFDHGRRGRGARRRDRQTIGPTTCIHRAARSV